MALHGRILMLAFDAGIVDGVVEAAERFNRVGDHVLHILGRGHIRLDGRCIPSGASISVTSEARSSSRRAATTTLAPFAPKASAVALPIPLLAPVISATRPFMCDTDSPLGAFEVAA